MPADLNLNRIRGHVTANPVRSPSTGMDTHAQPEAAQIAPLCTGADLPGPCTVDRAEQRLRARP
jgi:hypothetical protein